MSKQMVSSSCLFFSSQDLTHPNATQDRGVTHANPSAWLPVVNTFIDFRETGVCDSRRKLKPFRSCGDDIPDPTAPKIDTMSPKDEDHPDHAPPDSLPEGREREFVHNPKPHWVPRVRNTFVDVFDASQTDGRRQLKPFLSCGDMPDPVLRVDPRCMTVDEGVDCAYTGPSHSSRERSRSPSDVFSNPLGNNQLYPSLHSFRQARCHNWDVDARKLQSKDKQIVLPVFTAYLGDQEATFRVIISSRDEAKRSTSFVKSGGRGSLQIKCQIALTRSACKLLFRAWVGNDTRWQSSPELVSHDFAENPVCDLPASWGQWDFGAAVNQSASSFRVCVEEVSIIDRIPEMRTPEKVDNSAWPLAQELASMLPSASPEKLPLVRNLFGAHGTTNSELMLNKILDDDWSFSSSDSDSDDDV